MWQGSRRDDPRTAEGRLGVVKVRVPAAACPAPQPWATLVSRVQLRVAVARGSRVVQESSKTD